MGVPLATLDLLSLRFVTLGSVHGGRGSRSFRTAGFLGPPGQDVGSPSQNLTFGATVSPLLGGSARGAGECAMPDSPTYG